MKSVIKLLRLHHSIKNILIFLPLIFSGNLLNPNYLAVILPGFLVFVCLSSAVYVINDIADCEKDRLHPTKCRRPIASGAVSKGAGVIIAAILLVVAFAANFLITRTLSGAALPAIYFAMNLAYSAGLKEVPMVDIVILVSGFLLRVLYGSFITGIPVSSWMYLTVISVSFYLGLGKRRNELAKSGSSTRKVLSRYTYEFLDKNMYISNALTLIFYALWCTSADITEKFGGKMIWTVPLVMLISMKYSLNVEGSSDGDPVEVIIHDKSLLALSALYAAVILFMLYPVNASGGSLS